jgi:integrase
MAEDRKPVLGESVAAVLDDFLTWTESNRGERTYLRYLDFLQSFTDKYGRMKVVDLHTGHVTTWLDGKTTWNNTTKRNAIIAVQRGFNWAVKNRGLPRNPIMGMEKPEAAKRTIIVPLEEFEVMLASVADQSFRDLMIVAYDSGCRPQEVKRLEARHVELDRHRAVVPTEEGKGKIARAIYFPTERSLEIITRLVKEHPEGPMFLNLKGNPWTRFAVKCRFDRIQKKIGRRYRQYDFRHSFITRKLLAGVDSHIVAALAGHKDTKMIDSTYSHIADDYKFMLAQAQKEITPSSGATSEQKGASAAPKKARRRKSRDTPESVPRRNESPHGQDGNSAVSHEPPRDRQATG